MARGLISCLGGVLLVSTLVAAEPGENAAAPRRVTASYGDITCEYPEGHERLAWELAKRFTAHADALDARQPGLEPSADATVPLSAAELRANREDYLRRIASLLALEKPTALQEECFDEFLRNYELTMELAAESRRHAGELARVRRFAIWPRAELVRRLQAGEEIPGMTYDPATDRGRTSYGFSLGSFDSRLAQLAERREGLQRDYLFSIESRDGVTTYHGGVRPKRQGGAATDANSTDRSTPDRTDVFPVVVPEDLAGLPAAELAERLFASGPGCGITRTLEVLAQLPKRYATFDPRIAFLVLHETAESGVVGHYFRGKDRRWFCDGAANYVAWRVLRDRHGEGSAVAAYNLPSQLARYAHLARQVDLKDWPASEKQSAADRESDLNLARYAFATNALVLMHAKAGEDVLPRLLREIGKTRPNRVTMATVEKAWARISRVKLDALLDEAVSRPESTAVESAR